MSSLVFESKNSKYSANSSSISVNSMFFFKKLKLSIDDLDDCFSIILPITTFVFCSLSEFFFSKSYFSFLNSKYRIFKATKSRSSSLKDSFVSSNLEPSSKASQHVQMIDLKYSTGMLLFFEKTSFIFIFSLKNSTPSQVSKKTRGRPPLPRDENGKIIRNN
ncbi:hypothetical protein BpHYR1_051378 [Brachionus plicatilis]|uniref:Uncharacterized protein n=1 Tax=Brachionus plicatilis TaxID=10195 RepID=A0A3M7PRF7_BRAPC|nr:hypothetical protein BpHYR1_051378 [Brachionus plicatilis]